MIRKVTAGVPPTSYLGFSSLHHNSNDQDVADWRTNYPTGKSPRRGLSQSNLRTLKRVTVTPNNKTKAGPQKSADSNSTSWRLGQKLIRAHFGTNKLGESAVSRNADAEYCPKPLLVAPFTPILKVDHVMHNGEWDNRTTNVLVEPDSSIGKADQSLNRKSLKRQVEPIGSLRPHQKEAKGDDNNEPILRRERVVSRADLRALVRKQKEARREEHQKKLMAEKERRDRIQQNLAATASTASRAAKGSVVQDLSKQHLRASSMRVPHVFNEQLNAISGPLGIIPLLSNHSVELEQRLDELLGSSDTLHPSSDPNQSTPRPAYPRLRCVESSTSTESLSTRVRPLRARHHQRINANTQTTSDVGSELKPSSFGDLKIDIPLLDTADANCVQQFPSTGRFGTSDDQAPLETDHLPQWYNPSMERVQRLIDTHTTDLPVAQDTDDHDDVAADALLLHEVTSVSSNGGKSPLGTHERWMRLEAVGASEPELATEDEKEEEGGCRHSSGGGGGGRLIEDMRDESIPHFRKPDALLLLSKKPLIPLDRDCTDRRAAESATAARDGLKRLIYSDQLRFSTVHKRHIGACTATNGQRVDIEKPANRDAHQASPEWAVRQTNSASRTATLGEEPRGSSRGSPIDQTLSKLVTHHTSTSATSSSTSDTVQQHFNIGAAERAVSSTPRRNQEVLETPASLGAGMPPTVPSKQQPPRLTATALGLRMSAELNQLEALASSMQHVSEMESLRQFATAQAETVGLSQLLKIQRGNTLPGVQENHKTSVPVHTDQQHRSVATAVSPSLLIKVPQGPHSPQFEGVLRAAEEFSQVDRRLSGNGKYSRTPISTEDNTRSLRDSSNVKTIPSSRSSHYSSGGRMISSSGREQVSHSDGSLKQLSHVSPVPTELSNGTTIDPMGSPTPSTIAEVLSTRDESTTIAEVKSSFDQDVTLIQTSLSSGSTTTGKHRKLQMDERKPQSPKRSTRSPQITKRHREGMDSFHKDSTNRTVSRSDSRPMTSIDNGLADRAAALKARRERAERLLALSKSLELEEDEVVRLEREALKLVQHKRKQLRSAQNSSQSSNSERANTTANSRVVSQSSRYSADFVSPSAPSSMRTTSRRSTRSVRHHHHHSDMGVLEDDNEAREVVSELLSDTPSTAALSNSSKSGLNVGDLARGTISKASTSRIDVVSTDGSLGSKTNHTRSSTSVNSVSTALEVPTPQLDNVDSNQRLSPLTPVASIPSVSRHRSSSASKRSETTASFATHMPTDHKELDRRSVSRSSSGGATPPLRKQLTTDFIISSASDRVTSTTPRNRQPRHRPFLPMAASGGARRHRSTSNRSGGLASAESMDDDAASSDIMDLDEFAISGGASQLPQQHQLDISEMESRVYALNCNLQQQETNLSRIDRIAKSTSKDRLASLQSTLMHHRQLCTGIIRRIRKQLDTCQSSIRSEASHVTLLDERPASTDTPNSSNHTHLKTSTHSKQDIALDSKLIEGSCLDSVVDDALSATDTEGDLQKLNFDDQSTISTPPSPQLALEVPAALNSAATSPRMSNTPRYSEDAFESQSEGTLVSDAHRPASTESQSTTTTINSLASTEQIASSATDQEAVCTPKCLDLSDDKSSGSSAFHNQTAVNRLASPRYASSMTFPATASALVDAVQIPDQTMATATVDMERLNHVLEVTDSTPVIGQVTIHTTNTTIAITGANLNYLPHTSFGTLTVLMGNNIPVRSTLGEPDRPSPIDSVVHPSRLRDRKTTDTTILKSPSIGPDIVVCSDETTILAPAGQENQTELALTPESRHFTSPIPIELPEARVPLVEEFTSILFHSIINETFDEAASLWNKESKESDHASKLLVDPSMSPGEGPIDGSVFRVDQKSESSSSDSDEDVQDSSTDSSDSSEVSIEENGIDIDDEKDDLPTSLFTTDNLRGLVADVPERTGPLIRDALTHLWLARLDALDGSREEALRRAVLSPPESFQPDWICHDNLDPELHALSGLRFVNRTLLFDLLAEFVQQWFAGEDEEYRSNLEAVADGKAVRPHVTSAQFRMWKGPVRPLTQEPLFKLAEAHVQQELALCTAVSTQSKKDAVFTRNFVEPDARVQLSRLGQWTMSKKPYLDRLLELELRAEETTWLAYGPEEMRLKGQLSEQLWQEMLQESMDAVLSLARKRASAPTHHSLTSADTQRPLSSS